MSSISSRHVLRVDARENPRYDVTVALPIFVYNAYSRVRKARYTPLS
jgi:hypothetical protein